MYTHPKCLCSRGRPDLSNEAIAANLPPKLMELWPGKYLFTICSLWDTITLYLVVGFACFLIATDSPLLGFPKLVFDSPKLNFQTSLFFGQKYVFVQE